MQQGGVSKATKTLNLSEARGEAGGHKGVSFRDVLFSTEGACFSCKAWQEGGVGGVGKECGEKA